MRYVGNKSRYAKYILEYMQPSLSTTDWYVEPFCGALGVLESVTSKHRIANDSNPYLIALWKAVQSGWIPPENVSYEMYVDIRDNKDNYVPYLVGFVGFGCSFGGKFFGGYARSLDNNGNPRNYAAESVRNIKAMYPNIKDVVFFNRDYTHTPIPMNAVVYCDPPYANAQDYGTTFNTDEFFNWCRWLTKRGNKVFISEYQAPEDFQCIWSKEVNNTLDKNTGSKQGVERLYVLR